MNFYTPATTLVTLFYMGTAFFLSAEYARKEDTIEWKYKVCLVKSAVTVTMMKHTELSLWIIYFICFYAFMLSLGLELYALFRFHYL